MARSLPPIALCLGAFLLAAGCGAPRNASAPFAYDNNGRPTVAVTIDGKGPFPFVLDTAAERTMVQRRLADSLALFAAPGVDVRVEATGGTTMSRMLVARSFRGALFARTLEPLFELPNGGVTGADGIVGMNVFAGRRLVFDFAAGTATIVPASEAGNRAVPARVMRGDLVLVPVTVGGVRAEACIDTGARRTLGNLALARALGLRAGDPRLTPAAPVTGASADSVAAWSAPVARIAAGSATFAAPTITFSDAPVFARMCTADAPRLVLGIDLLHRLHRLAIDYRRAEVSFEQL